MCGTGRTAKGVKFRYGGDVQDGHRCQAIKCSTAGYVVYGLACAASVLAFLGALIGAPVYLYLVKLPGLDCPE